MSDGSPGGALTELTMSATTMPTLLTIKLTCVVVAIVNRDLHDAGVKTPGGWLRVRSRRCGDAEVFGGGA